MNKTLLEWLGIIVALGLFSMLVVWGFTQVQSSRSKADSAVSSVDSVYEEISNEEFTRYEGTDVSGSEVLSIIKRYDGKEIGVIVTINAGSTTTSTCYCTGLSYSSGVASYNTSTTLGTLAAAKDITNTGHYINPTKRFIGSVLKDSAGNIIGLHFTLDN